MPYGNTFTLLDTGGGPTPTRSVTARLWMMWSELNVGNRQQEEGSQEVEVSLNGKTPASFDFVLGPFNQISKQTGISLQDTERVANDTGWLFRSGRFDAALPTDPIEVIAGPTTIPASDLPGLLPVPPFAVSSKTTVTALSATMVQGGIDVIATGTTTETGVVVGFRFTTQLKLAPSSDVAAVEPLEVGMSNPTLVFVSGPSVLSAIEAELANLLRVFLTRDAFPALRRNLEARVNAAVSASAGASLPGGALPEGVTLSIRSVAIRPTGIEVRGALGAFGGVLSKLPSAGGGSFSCALQTLQTMGLLTVSLETFRGVREALSQGAPAERALVERYYRASPEAAHVLLRHPLLALRGAKLASELAALIDSRRKIPSRLRREGDQLLAELGRLGSERLREEIAGLPRRKDRLLESALAPARPG